MSKSFLKKILITKMILIIVLIGVQTFAIDPSFEILPLSGQTLKLHCKYTFNTKLNAGGETYNGFAYAIKFDPLDLSIVHSSIDPFFSTVDRSIKNGNIYHSQGAATVGSNTDRILSTFTFQTLRNITKSTLNFTNCEGGSITFDPNTTDDCAVLNGFLVGGLDILASTKDSTYDLSPLPCVIDTDGPKISNINISDGQTQVPSYQSISMLINDRHGNPNGNVSGPFPLQNNKRSHYRYSGLSTQLENYQPAPITVDNQQGVDLETITIQISFPGEPSYGTFILSGTDLSISEFEGSSTVNKFTRDSKIRGYNISFQAPIPYPVEKQVNILISARDRQNENGQTNLGTKSFSFNHPINPTANLILPSTTTFVNPKTKEIKIYLTDDRAGIDTGSVQFTIPSIFSGETLIMEGYTYSGNELNFHLSGGDTGLGNKGNYIVSIMSKQEFPSNSTITITGQFNDLAGNQGNATFSFSTRPDCDFFGCPMFLGIHIGSTISYFNGNYLIITGTNLDSPYPYFTGSNNDILVCGPNYTGTTINGNIPLQDKYGESIIGIFYTGKQLYITGLDITMSGNIIFIQ